MIFAVMSHQALAQETKPLKYCTHAQKINLSPFYDYTDDVYNLGYLLLLVRPYIVKNTANKNMQPLLESWHFNPGGRVFHGVVAENARWSDGKRLTAREAAMGIARGLKHRMLGKRIQVKGTDSIGEPGGLEREYSGIKILSKYRFQLEFEGEFENSTGVLVEALSEDSRPNLMWPVRLANVDSKGAYLPGKVDLVSRYPIKFEDGNLFFIIANGRRIRVATSRECENSDFYSLSIPGGQYDKFTSSLTSTFQTVLGVVNSTRLKTQEERRNFSGWLRSAFSSRGHSVPSGHFQSLEAGHDPKVVWPMTFSPSWRPKNPIRIATIMVLPKDHYIQTTITEAAKKIGVSVDFFSSALEKDSSYDCIIFAAKVVEGRQLWLQDVDLSHLLLQYGYHGSKKALDQVKKHSASTVTIRHRYLQKFANAAIEDLSIIPLVRRKNALYSSKKLEVRLVFDQDNNMIFEWEDQNRKTSK